MIRVSIEVIPRGGGKSMSTLETIDIDQEGDDDVIGAYNFKASGVINKTGKVENFPKFNGAVRLVYKVMKEMTR